MIAVLLSILNKRTLLSINPTRYRTVGFEVETPKRAGAGLVVCGQVSSGVAEHQLPEPYTLRHTPLHPNA